MFIDASAMVAILTREPGDRELAAKIERAQHCTTSAIAIWETTIRIVRKLNVSRADADRLVAGFLTGFHIELVSIGPAESVMAVEAWDRFGKGRGHPAKLNLGDCFAYACARTNKAELLFVGDDFSQTDVNVGFGGGEAG